MSVIPTVAQIFEKITYHQLCDYLNDNNLLTRCQSGLRSLHSTLTALIESTNSWSVNIDNGLVNGVIFIDLKKAFDTIDHTILIRKLRKYGVDSSSLKWFESYLCDGNQKCCTNGHSSNTAPVTCGVPQGSNLGPLLFLVYINDLPNSLTSASPRIFADDTNITFASSTMTDLENAVNLELRNLQRWLTTNRLSLKDVRDNCFSASLLRTNPRANSHATSCIERGRQVLKWTMIEQMAIAIALLRFNDLGRSVTLTFLFRNRLYSQLSPHCQKMNKKSTWEVKKISRFQSTGHGILPSCACKARETMVSKCKLILWGTSPVD